MVVLRQADLPPPTQITGRVCALQSIPPTDCDLKKVVQPYCPLTIIPMQNRRRVMTFSTLQQSHQFP